MPIIQPPPAPPKKITIGVRFEEQKLAALRRYGVFLGTRNLSHIISESLERVYRMDKEYNAWLKIHPDIAIEKTPRRNGTAQLPRKAVTSGTVGALAGRNSLFSHVLENDLTSHRESFS